MTSGIGDYWFFLLSNGTDYKYDEGLLALCNGGRSLDGIGMLNAFTILYHAMLMKTSDSSYPAYRLWTVTAARNLFQVDWSAQCTSSTTRTLNEFGIPKPSQHRTEQLLTGSVTAAHPL